MNKEDISARRRSQANKINGLYPQLAVMEIYFMNPQFTELYLSFRFHLKIYETN
jgi:hypothetical protein